MQDRQALENEIMGLYELLRCRIAMRLEEFRNIREHGSDEDIFYELVFCLLTPASKAQAAWEAARRIRESGLLLGGNPGELADVLKRVRFRNIKALCALEAARQFLGNGTLRENLSGLKTGILRREWLLKSVRGMGYKEASHFLRNIGLSEGLAILDRHILRGLWFLQVIEDVPSSLSPKRYLSIEEKMQGFALRIGIPMEYLDFVLWYMETKTIFK